MFSPLIENTGLSLLQRTEITRISCPPRLSANVTCNCLATSVVPKVMRVTNEEALFILDQHHLMGGGVGHVDVAGGTTMGPSTRLLMPSYAELIF